MPWTINDVDGFIKGLDPVKKAGWVKIANGTLSDCLKGGGGQQFCEGKAIRIANAMAKRVGEATDISFNTELIEATTIDKEKGIYGVTLIKEGFTTDKRRYYPRATLEAALPLFEGLQAYADHPTKSEMKDRPERSIRDLVGVYKNPAITETMSGSSLGAELHTIESMSWMRPILNMTVDNPGLCGLSIHGDGQITPKGKDGADIVESIDKMFSTDIVTKPNAGGEINRLIASNREGGGVTSMEWSDITLETLKENRPELVEELDKTAREDERIKVEAEMKEAATKEDKEPEGEVVKKEDYDKLAETVEAMKIEKKIAESKLLEVIEDEKDKEVAEKDLTDELAGKSDEDMDKVIEARKIFLKSIKVDIEGAPAKEAQSDKKKHIPGSILSEAKNA